MTVEAKPDAALCERVAQLAATEPNSPAFVGDEGDFSWSAYLALLNKIASALRGLHYDPGARVAVLLPDGPHVHAALLATERAGLVALGIGPRAGRQEIDHLLLHSQAVALISRPEHQGMDMTRFVNAQRLADRPLQHHLVLREMPLSRPALAVDGSVTEASNLPPPDATLRPHEVSLLNSTSGTTGMPKIVVHDLARWKGFHSLAVPRGRLRSNDVFMSLVPTPFGFGLWTSHVTPTLLGCPVVVIEQFEASRALDLIETHRVTVLAAVSTQFIMMIAALDERERDLSSLRVLFTGGEAVPYQKAAEFEDRTGATVLQFYGSNETGAVSATSLDDDRELRLRSAGRIIPEMNVRLFDDEGNDVTASGRGRPGCKGPTLSRGYEGPESSEANSELIRPDGWMMLGDLVTLENDVLTVVGRTDDFIIRGGKNVSGPAVEAQVMRHPAVALAAAVSMPDPVFGERVCVYVELNSEQALDLETLKGFLAENAVSKEWWPERLELVDALPRGSGGKIAKGTLREQIRAKLEAETEQG